MRTRAAPVFAECRRIEKEVARITAEWGRTLVAKKKEEEGT
jgi:hypothetical protein